MAAAVHYLTTLSAVRLVPHTVGGKEHTSNSGVAVHYIVHSHPKSGDCLTHQDPRNINASIALRIFFRVCEICRMEHCGAEIEEEKGCGSQLRT
jgi:hypothetical protein